MSNNLAWVMGGVVTVSLLAAAGVGFAGYRSTPHALPPAPRDLVGTSTGSPTDDPLTPRLFNQTAPIRIHVAGAVKKPGVYSLPAWARVVDAVKKAGGATPNADLDGINLADKLKDAEQLRIPVKGRAETVAAHPPTPEPPPVPETTGGIGSGRYPFTHTPAAAGPDATDAPSSSPTAVNLNTATREELDRLPGVGPGTAEKILAYRQEHGPFLRAEDVMNVPGIGPGKFARIRDAVAAQ